MIFHHIPREIGRQEKRPPAGFYENTNAGGDLFEKRSSPRIPRPKTLNILAVPVGRRSVVANPDNEVTVPSIEIREEVDAILSRGRPEETVSEFSLHAKSWHDPEPTRNGVARTLYVRVPQAQEVFS